MAPKFWIEKTYDEKLAEAHGALGRLKDRQAQNSRSPNFSHEIAKNTRDAIKRWENTLKNMKEDKNA